MNKLCLQYNTKFSSTSQKSKCLILKCIQNQKDCIIFSIVTKHWPQNLSHLTCSHQPILVFLVQQYKQQPIIIPNLIWQNQFSLYVYLRVAGKVKLDKQEAIIVCRLYQEWYWPQLHFNVVLKITDLTTLLHILLLCTKPVLHFLWL